MRKIYGTRHWYYLHQHSRSVSGGRLSETRRTQSEYYSLKTVKQHSLWRKVHSASKTWIKVFLHNQNNACVALWERSDRNLQDSHFYFILLFCFCPPKTSAIFRNARLHNELLKYVNYSCDICTWNVMIERNHNLCMTSMSWSIFATQFHQKRTRICTKCSSACLKK